MLRPQVLLGARAGTRTHLCLPATFLPKTRTAVGEEARARNASAGVLRMPSLWVKLEVGDRLWVQEDVAELHDRRGVHSRAFYKLDLTGGHVPIPGGAKGSRYTTRTVEARLMPRDHSRYTLEVTGVAEFRAQEIGWDRIAAEGPHDKHQTMGQWWERAYGFTMPWSENPPLIGLSFKFTDANVDGQRWVPDAPAASGGGPDLIRKWEAEAAAAKAAKGDAA
jgi:hypothetical protein